MRFLFLFILSGLTAFFFGVYLPHWGLMLAIAVLAGLIGGDGWMAFFAAGLAVGAVWLFVPYTIISETSSDLPEKVASIMGQGNSALLYVATSLMGFLIAGFGALTGNRFRNLFEKHPIKY